MDYEGVLGELDKALATYGALSGFDEEELEREVARVEGKTPASRADRIAHRTKKELAERMDEDPVLFKKLSKLIQEAIDDFHQRRIDEQTYLRRVLDAQRQAAGESAEDVPGVLQGHPEAMAYFNTLEEELGSGSERGRTLTEEQLAGAGLRIQEIVEAHKIIDWTRNADIEKRMEDAIDDYLIDSGLVDLSEGEERLDRILKQALQIARSRSER